MLSAHVRKRTYAKKQNNKKISIHHTIKYLSIYTLTTHHFKSLSIYKSLTKNYLVL